MNLRFENTEASKFVVIPHYTIGLRSLTAALKKLSGLKITSLKTWLLTDDIWIDFTYKGHQFKIDTFLLDFALIPENPECPSAIFEEIIEHLKNTPVRWWRRFV